MTVHVNRWEWKSAEECLQWLFANHPDMQFRKGLHVWQESFASIGGGNLAGSYRHLSPKMLEGRIYSVRFCDDSVAIRYHDQVFADIVPNRRYPESPRCVLVRLPTITKEIEETVV
jgi:hypothetical protein